MKSFVLKVSLLFLPHFFFILIGIFLPATPSASKSLLFSKIQKDSLLQSVRTPRIIFIGGSNLSFSLNSQTILDSLSLNPINTGIEADLGLIYMMDNTLKYIKPGDTIIIIPEYQHFSGNFAFGDEGLIRTILDVNPHQFFSLRFKQFLNIVRFIPIYSLPKLKPTEYLIQRKESDVYGVNSYNKFGDTYTHWGMGKQKFEPFKKISGEYNEDIIKEIVNFQTKLHSKNATLYVSYPAYQDLSFVNSKGLIKKFESEFKKYKLKFLGTQAKYMIPDSFMFNTPYHLNKKGVDYRTNLFIKDFRTARLNKK